MLFLLRDRLFPILVFLQSVLCGCGQKHDRGGFVNVAQRYSVVQTGRMRQPTVQESSGFARISPDGRTVALLGYSHTYLLERQPGRYLFDGPKYCLPLPATGQAETLAFLNNTNFALSNEKGRIYRVTRKP